MAAALWAAPGRRELPIIVRFAIAATAKNRLFFPHSKLKACTQFMLIRFAIVPLFLAFSLPTCKKGQTPANNPTQSPTPGAPAAAGTPGAPPAATPVPTPVETKPAIDQHAQVVIFGYHRFVNQVRRPDTEITPAAFEAQMKELQDKKIPVIANAGFSGVETRRKSHSLTRGCSDLR